MSLPSLVRTLCLSLPLVLAAVAFGAESKPLQVLMITGGEYHDYKTLPAILADRLTQRGEMKVEVVPSILDLDIARLAGADVLLFNNCEQTEVPEALQQAILAFVRNGKGLVAMHCALWSYQNWSEWTPLVGGFAPGHDRFGAFPVSVLDATHATMLGVGNRFEITDEAYYVDKRDRTAEVLARTSHVLPGPDGKPREGPDPQVWIRSEGQGRVFAVTFGHDEKSQGDERFITLLHNGVRWAGRGLPDTPHNVLTRGEERAGFKLLFNGANLDGWLPEKHWSVEDGTIVGRTAQKGDLKHNQFLIARGEYGDFFLKFSVRLRNGNSGVQFRSRAFDEFVVKGYQADAAEGWYGSLYEEGGKRRVLANGWKDRGEKVAVLDGWNEMTVRAVGPKITITLNGLTTVEYEEKEPGLQPARGVIALQIHAGPAMEVRFRDIRIQPLDK